ncbi:hypothetical protein [uncultured Treponema sp.]|uniref:hypothetical protein n=1 Tax=uncultured Treponema sp. TaxID=162155 RepID=UPI0026385F9B|nr:hypothetical protein [uncultured Treponema sp.]
MKKTKAVLCAALMLLTALLFSQSSAKVCVSAKGRKYHTANCRTIKNSAITMLTKEEAIRAGYEACKICKP